MAKNKELHWVDILFATLVCIASPNLGVLLVWLNFKPDKKKKKRKESKTPSKGDKKDSIKKESDQKRPSGLIQSEYEKLVKAGLL